MSKIDDFKEYARRRIVERLREAKNGEDSEKEAEAKNGKIEPYNGDDAFYEGSDEEYREFLDGLDVDLNGAEPVSDGKKEDLGETINVKEMLGRVREKAGDIAGAAAAKVSEAAAAHTKFKVRGDDDDMTRFEKVEENISVGIDDMKTAIADSMNDSMQKMEGIDARIGGVSELFSGTKQDVAKLKNAAAEIEKRVRELEIRVSGAAEENAAAMADVKHSLSVLSETADRINETVNGVSKLTDSVFDLKNAQQNTKTALSELQTAFARLKRKTVAGITIISIIGFIIIVLEVINLLA